MRLRHLLIALLAVVCGQLGAATFTATGTSADVQVTPGNTLTVALSGVWVATVNVERKVGSAGYQPIYVAQSNTTYTITDPGTYHLNCIAFTSGTVTYAITAPAGYQVNYRAPNGASVFSVDNAGVVTAPSIVTTSPAISGGTIDGATIGATTASTGAFTTLTASGKTAVAASGLSAFGIFDVGEGGTNPLTGTTQQGVRSVITSTTAATSATHGMVGVASTAASSYTCGFAAGGYFQFGTLGAGSTVTRAAGLLAERATAGTNMAGLVIIDAGGSPAWSGTFAIDSESSQPSLFSGDVRLGVAGNGLLVKEGTNARMGVATLAAGTVTVANTSVTASTRIHLTGNADGGTPGWVRVSARSAGTSFTITSSSGTDTSTVAWLLVEPSP